VKEPKAKRLGCSKVARKANQETEIKEAVPGVFKVKKSPSVRTRELNLGQKHAAGDRFYTKKHRLTRRTEESLLRPGSRARNAEVTHSQSCKKRAFGLPSPYPAVGLWSHKKKNQADTGELDSREQGFI